MDDPTCNNQDQQDLSHTVDDIKSHLSDASSKVSTTLMDAKDKVYDEVKDGMNNLKDKYQQDIQPRVIQMKDQFQQDFKDKKDAANTMLHERVLDSNYSFKNLAMVFIAGWIFGRIIRN